MLTDIEVRRAKADGRPLKLADSGGLFLHIATSGHKSWRFKYRFAGKEKLLTIGPYPAVSLADARDRRDEAKRELRSHRDPSIEKKKRAAIAHLAADNNFEKVARAWFETNKSRWSPVHAGDVIGSLERDVFPTLGALPVSEIDEPMVLNVLQAIERRPAIETAKRVRQRMSAVFVYAIAKGIGNGDPAAVVKGALKPLPRKRNQRALIRIDEARQTLIDAEAEKASPVTKLALRLLALTAVRPGVVRGAAWDEFEGLDGDHPLWRIPAQRMKLRLENKHDESFEHLVPLSRQAVEVVEAVRRLTGHCPLLFPNSRNAHKPMSENAIGYLLNRAGYHQRHVPHGWRSSFSTVMNELAEREGRPGDRAVIDLMLAHVPENKVEGAYNRAAYMPRRREIAQAWADLLLEGMQPASALLEGARR